MYSVHFLQIRAGRVVVCELRGKLGQGAEALLHFATHQIIHSCKSQTAEKKPSGLSDAAGFSVQKAEGPVIKSEKKLYCSDAVIVLTLGFQSW